MTTGGMAALAWQALHPLILTALWDSADQRDSLRHRIYRTALFIATTTFGPSVAAQAAVDRVRAIHAQVRGITPDGRPYAGDDPHLLTFIHITEVYCCVMAYDTLVRPMSMRERNSYVAETACVALALGAKDVANDWAELLAALQTYGPDMASGTRPLALLRLLHSMTCHPLSHAATDRAMEKLQLALGGQTKDIPMHHVMQAASTVLPDHVLALYGLTLDPQQTAAAKSALRAVVPTMRWALRDGVATQARRRTRVLEPSRPKSDSIP